jgi:hypothetical protein
VGQYSCFATWPKSSFCAGLRPREWGLLPVPGDDLASITLRQLGPAQYRGGSKVPSSSPSIMIWMKPRTRSRTAAKIGSNQLSKSSTAVSAATCEKSCFVICSSWRRLLSGAPTPDDFEVEHPGDYATFNSNQLCDRTAASLDESSNSLQAERSGYRGLIPGITFINCSPQRD